MVRVINPYAPERPIGAMLSQIGQQLFGDQAGAALNREQAYAAQRSNAETDNLMRWAATGQNLTSLSPEAAAMLIGSGYDPNDLGRIGSLYASTNLGARADETTNWQAGLGEYGQTAEAFDFDQANQRSMNDADNAAALARQNALPMSALDPFGNPAFTTQGNTEGFTPVLPLSEAQGVEFMRLFPTLTPQQQLTGIDAAPSLDQVKAGVATGVLGAEGGLGAADPNTQAFIGADVNAGAQTPRTYLTPDGRTGTTLDGVTDAMTNEPLPQGTIPYSSTVQAASPGDVAGVTTPLYRAMYAQEDAYDLGEAVLESARNAAPEAFGVAGTVATLARGLVNTVGNLGGLLGLDLNSETLAQWAQANSPNLSSPMVAALFGPDFNETQRLAGLYVYQVAAVLTGQTGQDLSDKDVRAAMAVVGDPRGFGTTRETFIAGVEGAQARIAAALATSRRRLGITDPAAAGTPAPAGAAPAGAPAPDAEGWTTLPDGTQYRQVSP